MRYFRCYTLRLANYLINKGYWIIGFEPNQMDSRKEVYLFPDTEEIRRLVDKYCEGE